MDRQGIQETTSYVLREARAPRPWLAVWMALGLMGVACGEATANKAGGAAAPKVTTLTFANNNEDLPGQIAAFTEAVDAASEGTIKFEFEHAWRDGETAQEAGTIDDVKS